jgi:amino acid adenylation domain-containing protein/non-ribosomal peptide synthase protein (TIGR01720 family)
MMSQRNTQLCYDVPLLVSNAFDISLFETFLPLLSGGTAFMTSEDQMKDVAYLAGELQHVNAFHAVPALMSQIVNHISENKTQEKYTGITDLFIGGDAVPTNVLQEMNAVFPYANIHVLYGPTEATIFMSSIVYPAGKKVDFKGTLIGRPIENRKIYILDKQGRLCPVGVTGEICIGGAILARGYLNQSELTEQKFVPDPFEEDARIYRTGDLGKWLPDGSVEFAGRIDDQVKIRGYRIEPGEIERTLEKHKHIQSAIVLTHANGSGEKELVAYIVGTEHLNVQDLRAYLAETLPHYMVPAYFVQLEALPLTPNGKINRKALPAPEEMSLATGVAYVPAQNETQQRLIAIWEEILGRTPIGIKDNFFNLGGHSLKATRLASHISREFQVKITLKELFSKPVLEDQALLIKDAVQAVFRHIPVTAPEVAYPLSSAQRRLWLLSQFEEGNIAYNMPAVHVFNGKLNHAAMEAAFLMLVKRHEILRTVFRADEDGNIRQFVLRPDEFSWRIPCYDKKELTLDSRELKNLVQQEINRPFDLSAGPLLRACLFSLAPGQWVFVNTMHHIISDGWSVGILINELLQAYNASVTGARLEPAPLRIQYKDYAVWQQAQLGGVELQQHRNYWMEQLSGELPVLDLPGKQLRPAAKTYNGGAVLHRFPASLSNQVQNLLREEGCTLFMGMLAAVNTLLYRYTGQEDVIIGTPVAGREHADLDDQIGFYVNMLALRSRFGGADSYRTLLAAVKQLTLNGYARQMYPFDELVNDLQLQRDISRNPLFDVMVVLQNTGLNHSLPALNDLQVSGYPAEESIASKYDLSFIFSATDEHIYLRLEYNNDIYDSAFAAQMARHLEQLCKAIVTAPDHSIQQLDYLTAAERFQLVEGFNNSTALYPLNKTIVDLFDEQVKRTPDHFAVISGRTKLTYRQLDERANRLANYLHEHYAAGPGDCIGVMPDRSEWMVIAIMGILKSGAAYVPIDPAYPAERKKTMIKDAGLKVLLTEAAYLYSVETSVDVIDIRWATSENAAKPLNTEISANDLAFVIYTSGSTGTPKGVMIEHHSLVNICFWHSQTCATGASDRAALYTGVAFDVAIWEVLPYLFRGACVYVVPADIRLDMEKLAAFYETNRITASFMSTPIAERFMEFNVPSLRYLFAGGDKLTTYRKRGYHIINIYGPSETTVLATSYHVTEDQANIPVGKPIANCRVYILSGQNALCPIGVTGEICIAGQGLSRGYVGAPELTAEKFVPDPFRPGELMYRTGDFGRWLPDGNLVFAGRKDDQVKIRGNRIELGEIKSVLVQHEQIDDAVVLVKKDNNEEKILVAWLAGKDLPDTTGLRTYLSNGLPAFMVPHHFINLESFPLTPNGKIDKKRLPEPEIQTGSLYEAPRHEKEALLAAVLEEVLRKKPVGVKDDFFVLGGDSIKSMLVVSRLKQKGYLLRIQDILLHPVVEELVGYMKAAGEPADQHTVTGIVPLGPVQASFLYSDQPDKHHFNQSVLLKSKTPVDAEGIRQVLHKIVMHHDALRMVYRTTGNEWIQENTDIEHAYSFEVIPFVNEADFVAHCERVQAVTDIEKGPLLKAVLFTHANENRLLIVVHHLVIDGVSWRILFKDLFDLYTQYMHGDLLTLPAKTHSFKHWQQQQVLYAQSDVLMKEAPFWEAIDNTVVPLLPLDMPTGENLIKDVAFSSFSLDEQLTAKLLTECYKAYHTDINDILLTTTALALAEIFGMKKMAVKLEGHGREEIGGMLDVTRTVGWFTSMYPVVFDLSHCHDPELQLVNVKEVLHRIPNKGIGYGILRYLAKKPYSLEPEITFNYLGDFGNGIGVNEDEQLFSFSGEYHGAEVSGIRRRDAILEFTGIVTNNTFRLTIAYSKAQYKANTIDQLLSCCRKHLSNLIRRLSAEKQTHVTPVDLTFKGLTMEQLQALSKKIK